MFSIKPQTIYASDLEITFKRVGAGRCTMQIIKQDTGEAMRVVFVNEGQVVRVDTLVKQYARRGAGPHQDVSLMSKDFPHSRMKGHQVASGGVPGLLSLISKPQRD